MTKIYLFCTPLGTGSGMVNGSTFGGDVMGYAVGEDGRGLASHLSSNEDFSKHDMGLTSNWKHEHYSEIYPDGFELIWVDDPDNHEGLTSALALNEKLYQERQNASRPKTN